MRYLTKAGKFYICDLFAGALVCLKHGITAKDIERVDWIENTNNDDVVWGIYPHTYRSPRGLDDRTGKLTLYRAFGTLWQKYGPMLCLDPDYIDQHLCLPIDNNFYTLRARDPKIDNIFNVVDKQYHELELDITDSLFIKGVEMAKDYLITSIELANEYVELRIFADTHLNVYNREGIANIPIYREGVTDLARNYPSVNFVIMPNKNGVGAIISTVKDRLGKVKRNINHPNDGVYREFDKNYQTLICPSISDAQQCAYYSIYRRAYA